MRNPQGGHGWLDRFAGWAYRMKRIWWVRLLVGPVIVSLPPALIALFYGNALVKEQLIELMPMTSWLLGHSLLVAGSALAYPIVMLGLGGALIERAEARIMPLDSILRVDAAIDNVVGYKEQRFIAHKNAADELTKETVFCTITQPDAQIRELVRCICELFNLEKDGRDTGRLIRVVLAEISDGAVTRKPVFFPQDEPVRIPNEILNHPNSTIMTAYRTRSTVVIESIRAEMKKPQEQRRYAIAANGNPDENVGSIICYPIVYDNEDVPFVISIHCDGEGHFKEAKRTVYQRMLDRFALRIRLEYSLLQMKEVLCAP